MRGHALRSLLALLLYILQLDNMLATKKGDHPFLPDPPPLAGLVYILNFP
jgi:hypothetical protein